MAFEVHREPLCRRYYAPCCSSTCLYMAVFGVILVILPLIIAYNSYDFWLKESYVLEQPQVNYKYQTNIQWYGVDSSTQEPVTYTYSTNSYLNSLQSATTRLPILSSATLDDNRDGLTDRVELSFALPLEPGVSIYGVTALVYYSVGLHSRAKYLFDALGYVNYESGTAMSKLSIDGDLILRQAVPFQVYGGYKNLYTGDQLLYDVDGSTSLSQVTTEAVMRKYNARNVSLSYQPRYEYVERRGLAAQSTAAQFFNTSVVMRVPLQPICYTPTVSATLKFAWIQYMSFFVVVAFLLFSLNSFLFSHNLLPAFSRADIVYEKTD